MTNILGEIAAGVHDDILSEIGDALHTRRQAIGRKNARVIVPGDTVRVIDMGPSYQHLVGATAQVVQVNRTKFVVRPLVGNWGRFAGSGRVTISMSCVEPV